ncbi:hypothetical protein HPB52_013315 [Rhipicephalus sanguineus]|uniref:Uncharacterized protein n=1 Tax=Rhipicephalus sanguineus TaxID=34632 RepID=A0A9D4PRY3_RHISA|nr:hypothetical protein HPB52_013315 [Rhipicephalus sanguineus]
METTSTGRLRKLAAKFSNLSRPDGSAILAQGETVVQAGVYGPVEVKQMREHPEKATVELLACAINAACLAAIDAAVSMKCHIAAVTAAITNTGIIVLDPDGQQEQEARAVCTFSFESQESKLVSTHTSGQFSKEEFQRCLVLSKAAAGDIFAFYQDALQKRYCRSLEADGDSDDD